MENFGTGKTSDTSESGFAGELVRIFIYAPKDYRTKKVMEMYGDTWDEGKKIAELTPALLRESVEKIAIHKSEALDGKRRGKPFTS